MATSNRPETPEEIIANLQRNKNKPAQPRTGNDSSSTSQPIGASAPESSQHEQLRTGNDKPETSERITPPAQPQPRMGNGASLPADPFQGQQNSKQPRNRGVKFVFGIVGVGIVAALVALVTIFAINSGDSNDNGPTSTAAPVAEEQVEPAAEKPAVADEQPEPAPVVEQPEPEPAVTTEQPLVIIVNPALLNGMSSDQLGVVRLQYPNRENIDVSHGDTVTRALSNTGSTNLSVTVVNEGGETVSQSEVADHNRMGLQIELPHADHRIDVGLAFNPETGELELDGDYPGLRLEDGILLVNELRQGELRSHTEQALDRGIPDDRRLTFVDPDGASSAEDAVDMLLRWGYASSRDDIQCIFSDDITVDAFVARRDGATAGFRETSLNGSSGYLCSVPVMNIDKFTGVPFNDMPPAAQMVMAGVMDSKDMGTKTVGTQEECINPFEPIVSTGPAPVVTTPEPVVTTPPAPVTSTPSTPTTSTTDTSVEDTVEDEVEEDRVEEVTEEAVEDTEETDEVDSEPQMQSFTITSEGAYSAVDCTDQGVQHAAQGIAVRGEGPYVFLTKTVQALSQEDAQEMVDADLTADLNDYHASLEQQIADGTACGTASQTMVDPAGREPEQAQPERLVIEDAEATGSVNMEHEGVVAGTQAEPTREPPAEGEETERIRNNAISDNSYDNPAPEPRVEKFASTPPQPSGDIAAESVDFELDSDGDGERDSDIGVGATSLQRSSTSE